MTSQAHHGLVESYRLKVFDNLWIIALGLAIPPMLLAIIFL
jgi:hypothetical protein